jgi:hypothetical protein
MFSKQFRETSLASVAMTSAKKCSKASVREMSVRLAALTVHVLTSDAGAFFSAPVPEVSSRDGISSR